MLHTVVDRSRGDVLAALSPTDRRSRRTVSSRRPTWASRAWRRWATSGARSTARSPTAAATPRTTTPERPVRLKPSAPTGSRISVIRASITPFGHDPNLSTYLRIHHDHAVGLPGLQRQRVPVGRRGAGRARAPTARSPTGMTRNRFGVFAALKDSSRSATSGTAAAAVSRLACSTRSARTRATTAATR